MIRCSERKTELPYLWNENRIGNVGVVEMVSLQKCHPTTERAQHMESNPNDSLRALCVLSGEFLSDSQISIRVFPF